MSYPKKIPPPGRRHVVDPLDRGFPMRAALHSHAAKFAPLQKRWALPRAWQLDQGQTPQCVAYAGKHWELSQPVSSHKGDSGLYPGDLYLRCKAIDGYPNEEGTDARTLLKVYQAMGKVGSYHWYDGSLEDVRLWLLTMGSCFLGAFWTESMFEPDINGMLTVDGDFQYGHEVLLIGYNRNYKLFELLNSWGPMYGVKGRAWIKEADLQRLLDANGDCVGAVEVRKPT